MILVCNPDKLPFATALASRKPPRAEMMVVVKASYAFTPEGALTRLPLGEASVTGDVYEPEAEDEQGEVLAPSDFAHVKLHPEVVLRATCHTPRGRPQTECGVSVTVGAWTKRLRVVGTRHWVGDALGGTHTEPSPFERMPIRWANAFGGPEVAENPIGVGGPESARLPNVELPEQPIERRGGKHTPAGFGPLNPLWPVRMAKMGKKYDEAWKATRAPFVAEDFDWTYHQSAPPDQWLSSLRGDERVVLENLHPKRSVIELRLPAQRAVAHARRKGKELSPVPLRLDTLYVDSEAGRLSLTWRGHLPVRELDLSDVHSLIIGLEDLAAPPRALAEVERDLSAFEADPAGLGAVKAEIEARFQALEKDLPPAPAIVDAPADPATAKLDGLYSEDSIVRKHVRAQMAQALSGPNADAILAALAKHEATSDAPPPTRGRPGVAPSTRLRSQLRPVAEKLALLRSKPDLPKEVLERAEAAEAELRSEALRKADPEYSYPQALSNAEPGPGADLVDRDFTGLSLAGLDLRGAKLDGAVLTRADLRGADLRGASLRGALLFQTKLGGAQLDEADLSRANLAHAEAREASFRGAKLDEASFQEAALVGASFVEAEGQWVVFERADLSRAALGKLRLERCDFGEAKLDGVLARRARLSTCLFERVSAVEADFGEAELERCVFRHAKLQHAKLVRARASRSSFDGADLEGADLSLVSLRGSHLSEARLVGAEAFGADLAEARLYRADLSGAVFERANLYGADLVATRVDRTSFVSANLYDAKLLEAAGEGADFSRANLERCLSSKPRRSEVEP